MSIPFRFAGSVGLVCAVFACSGKSTDSEVDGSGNSSSNGASSGIHLMVGGTTSTGTGGANNSGGTSPADQVVAKLPDGFHQTDIGGYKLGAMIADGSGSGGSGGGTMQGNCGNILLGVVRDFKGANMPMGHPDFNANIAGNDVTPNLVSSTLGADQKPVYTSMCEIGKVMGPTAACPYGPQTTTKANFDQWYRDTPGVNMAYTVSIWLQPEAGGLFTFQSLHYFPVDGAGFNGMEQADDGMLHNFSFTTELHTQFLYSGGEKFNFQGDDDVWVFINNKLAVDLGGLHPMQLRNIDLDQSAAKLGIKTGVIYPLDLFHAERHTDASTFRIDTNLSFVDCGTVIPGKPPA